MSLENAQLKDTQLDVLTVPANKVYAITSIMVCNTYSQSGVDPANNTANFDMHFIKNGQALSNSVTAVIRELDLPAGETFTFDSEKVVLDAGDKVAFVAGPGIYEDPNGDPGNTDLTNLAVSISYLEV